MSSVYSGPINYLNDNNRIPSHNYRNGYFEENSSFPQYLPLVNDCMIPYNTNEYGVGDNHTHVYLMYNG